MIDGESGAHSKPLFEVRGKNLADVMEVAGTMSFKPHQ
jgi:hypothetical protein